jgi:hypothetical protein
MKNGLLRKSQMRSWIIACGMFGIIICVLMCFTPIKRIEELHISGDFATPGGFTPYTISFLSQWSTWLPQDFHQVSNHKLSIYLASNIEILVFIALAFCIYGIIIFLISRRHDNVNWKTIRMLLWIGTIVAGLLFVVAPGMSSKDLFVYADIGNMVGLHHGNPYFTAPRSISPHDPLTIIDGWSYVTSAYGPLWIFMSAGISILMGKNPLHNFYAYRMLGLICDLINIFLIQRILRMLGRSERTITLGMAIYAWCPLTLFESSLGAHNDVFMSVFLLLGFLLSVRANQRGFTKPILYLPPLLAFTLATLVKFTTIPIVLIFLMVLASKILGVPKPKSVLRSIRWGPALLHVAIGGLVFGLLSLLAYLPFWVGHNIHDIIYSFSVPPSSKQSVNSLMSAVVNWQLVHGTPHPGSLLYYPVHILGSRRVWNTFDLVVMIACLLFGMWYAWKASTLRTLFYLSLGTSAAILAITPWFYSWYVIWLVAMLPLLLAFPLNRNGKTLICFVLTLSCTSFATYISPTVLYSPGAAIMLRYLLIIVPVIVATVLTYIFARSPERIEQVDCIDNQAFPTEIGTEEPAKAATI